MNIQNKRQRAAIQEKNTSKLFHIVIKQSQNSGNSKKHHEAKRGKQLGLFPSRLVFYFCPSQMPSECCRSPTWQRNVPSHGQQDFWPSRPWWLCGFTQYLLISPLWDWNPHIAIKLPAIFQSHPKSSDVFHFSRLIFDMSLSSLFPDRSWQFWQTYSLFLPIAFSDSQTSVAFVYTPKSQQTQKVQVMHKMQRVALLLKDITKAGNETQVSLLPAGAGPRTIWVYSWHSSTQEI